MSLPPVPGSPIAPETSILTQFVQGYIADPSDAGSPDIWHGCIPVGPRDDHGTPMTWADFTARALAVINRELRPYHADRNDFRIQASLKWEAGRSSEGNMVYRSLFLGSHGALDHGDVGLRFLMRFVGLGGMGFLRVLYYQVPETCV